MKIKTTSNILISLQTLGIVGLLLLAMAFSCNNGRSRDLKTYDKGKSQTETQTKRKGSGGCSTEEEFKEILTNNFSEIFNERDGKFKNTEIEFETFNIGKPFQYQKIYPELIDAENAYPVKASFITRDFLGGGSPRVQEFHAKNYKYVFYVDHHGDCVFSLENTGSNETKHLSYE